MPRRVLHLAAAVALIAGSACASSGSERGNRNRSLPPVEVRVTNNNWSDMRVYVVRGGERIRLGTVSTARTAVFRLPRSVANAAGALQLVADPIGSREFHVTQPVDVVPGQRLRFEIENHLAISTVSIW